MKQLYADSNTADVLRLLRRIEELQHRVATHAAETRIAWHAARLAANHSSCTCRGCDDLRLGHGVPTGS